MEPKSFMAGSNGLENNFFTIEANLEPQETSSVVVDLVGDKVRSRTFVPGKSNRRSASLIHDGKDYYQNYEDSKL